MSTYWTNTFDYYRSTGLHSMQLSGKNRQAFPTKRGAISFLKKKIDSETKILKNMEELRKHPLWDYTGKDTTLEKKQKYIEEMKSAKIIKIDLSYFDEKIIDICDL